MDVMCYVHTGYLHTHKRENGNILNRLLIKLNVGFLFYLFMAGISIKSIKYDKHNI